MPLETLRGSASMLSTNGSCSWCRTVVMSSSVAREVTNVHIHTHTHIWTGSLYTWKQKASISMSNQAAAGHHVNLTGSWTKRESQLPLRLIPALPPPVHSISALPCPRPECLFFHECMNKMKAREHWLWIWVSGLDILLHTHVRKLSLSH